MNTKKIKVSLIVPVYNTEKYLKKCLDSLISQTLQDIEIICINDGSTDKSIELLYSYTQRDQRLVVIDQENQGLSAARNAGVKIAQGQYLMFVDSDDWIESCMCDYLYQKACLHDADIAMCSYIKEFGNHSVQVHIYPKTELISDIGGIIRRLFGPIGTELEHPQDTDLPVSACMQIIRTKIARSIEFTDTATIGTEDLLYQIMVYSRCKVFVYEDIPFYHYRRSDYGTLTTRYMADKFERWGNLYNILFGIIEKFNYEEIYRKALLNRIAMSMIGLGLNEILAKKNLFRQARRLRNILKSPRYREAFDQLDFSFFPLHWKMFFLLCKYRWTFMLVCMLHCIEFLRKKVRK